MFASGRIVPFHTKPGSAGASDLADIPDSTDGAIIRQALANMVFTFFGHPVSFLPDCSFVGSRYVPNSMYVWTGFTGIGSPRGGWGG